MSKQQSYPPSKYMGVYYSLNHPDTPIMVMELMKTSLPLYVQNSHLKINLKTKISMLNDVSLGLSYLHLRKPSIIHRDLSPNNVMLSEGLVAKIGDLGVAKVIQADCNSTSLTRAPGTVAFMPPETLETKPVYDTPVDVFSFGGVSLYVLCEEWPAPLGPKRRDPLTETLIALSESERRQPYLEKIDEENAMLKQIIVKCLDDNPNLRPVIHEVSKTIAAIKVCMFRLVDIICSG